MRHFTWIMAGLLLCGFTVGDEVVVKGKVRKVNSNGTILFRPEGAITSITVKETVAALLTSVCLLLQGPPPACATTFSGSTVGGGGTGGGAGDITGPTTTMTAPADTATVAGNQTVSATCTDNVACAQVQFKLDGADFGAVDTIAPYEFTWNTTTVTNASHTWQAIGRDAAGNNGPSSIITVTVDNTAPASTITFDSASTATAGTNITAMTWAHTNGTQSNDLLLGACFLEDTAGSPDMTASSATYNGVAMTRTVSQDVPLTNAPNRLEMWYLLNPASGTNNVAFNFPGTVTSANCGAISVYNAKQEAPYVTASTFTQGGVTPNPISAGLTTTTNGDLVIDCMGSAAAESTATPDSGQTERFDVTHNPGPGDQLACGTKIISTAGAITHQWTSNDLARLGLGLVAIRDVNATVPADTTRPTVSITSHTNGETVSGTETLIATCTDASGVTDVQFKLNGTNQGSADTSSPYSTTWDTTALADGTERTITATCRDAAGTPNSNTSSDVTVTVNNSGGVATDGPNQPLWGGTEVSRWQTLQSLNGVAWQRLAAEADDTVAQDNNGAEQAICGLWPAMYYRATGDASYAQNAYDHWTSYCDEGIRGDPLRERFPQMGPIYYFISPALTASQRTTLVNILFALTDVTITDMNNYSCCGGNFGFDTDQIAGQAAGVYLGMQAILDDGRATSAERTTAQNYLNNGRIQEMKTRLEEIISHASGGVWMEGTNYNEGTKQFLYMLAAQFNDWTDLDAWTNKAARADLWSVTGDKQDVHHWGDVASNVIGSVDNTLFRRTPMLWSNTSLSGTDGTNSRNLLDTLGGTSFGGAYGSLGWLMARPDRSGTSYTASGVFTDSGMGIIRYNGTDSSFFTQFQPFYDGGGPISDHEVYFVGDVHIRKDGAWIVKSPWGYLTGGNEAGIRWGYGNTLLVGGQPSMYESRGILARDTDGPCYGQGGNTNGNRLQDGVNTTTNRWVHNWEEWKLYCPAGASGIDVLVSFTSVYKETTPALTGTPVGNSWETKRQEYAQYHQKLLAGAAPTVNNTTDTATWTVGSNVARAVWHYPAEVNLTNNGDEIRMEPTSPASRQFILYTVEMGGNATVTWNGTTLTIARSGESNVVCTPNLSNRAVTPSTDLSGNQVNGNINLYETTGLTNGLVCS